MVSVKSDILGAHTDICDYVLENQPELDLDNQLDQGNFKLMKPLQTVNKIIYADSSSLTT